MDETEAEISHSGIVKQFFKNLMHRVDTQAGDILITSNCGLGALIKIEQMERDSILWELSRRDRYWRFKT
jgi:phosphoribosylaminoimidazole (AIR) synthetase